MHKKDMRLKYNDIFNKDTLNIFTDASIVKVSEETIGCPGVVMVAMNEQNMLEVIHTQEFIVNHSTNNDSEIRAIHAGILCGLGYINKFKNINLFSDSNICIQGLKDWIFNWINCINNNIMYSSSGMPVANQEVFLAIVNTIVNSNFKINLYHQKGHVNINNKSSLIKAKNSMLRSNKLDDIDMDLIIQLSVYNDMVDLLTKDLLKNYIMTYKYEERKKTMFVLSDLGYTTCKISDYKNLIYNR